MYVSFRSCTRHTVPQATAGRDYIILYPTHAAEVVAEKDVQEVEQEVEKDVAEVEDAEKVDEVVEDEVVAEEMEDVEKVVAEEMMQEDE